MSSFRIELPLPPTSNNLYATNWKTKSRFLVSRAKDWKEEAGWLISVARPPKIKWAYTFQILIPSNAKGDTDGYIKLPQDLLVELGITPDDRNAQESRATRDESVPTGKCVICVEAV